MCGFCGFTGDIADRENIIIGMMNKIIHRGPDSAGTHSDEDVTMGFRRLSIIGLEDGSQPMYNEDGSIVICFNGEIYNYQLLKKCLLKRVMFSKVTLIQKFSFIYMRKKAKKCLMI